MIFPTEDQNSVPCVLQLKLLPFFKPEIPHVLNKWIDLVVVSRFVLTSNLIAMSPAPSHLVQSSEPGAMPVIAGIFLHAHLSMHLEAAGVCGSGMRTGGPVQNVQGPE